VKYERETIGHIINELAEMQNHLALSNLHNIRGIKSGNALLKDIGVAQYYFDFIGTIVVVIGADQKITFVNKNGRKILGCTDHKCVGEDWFENFIPERLRDNVRNCFKDLICGKTEGVEYYENLILTKDGKEKAIAWHNTVLHDNKGRIIGTLSSGLEVTEFRRMQVRLERLNECFINFCTDPEKTSIAL